ncbi:MAG TPA: tetratricopeptide repeat protein [Burkholderiaceae bacterium]|nr:tetratricopeptide repeat protein [Burkholderiaceae bacterium]
MTAHAVRCLVRAALVALAAGCLPAAGGAAEAPPRHVVKDPYFGDSLFYFYEGRYFTSLTGLMVSQHFDRLSHHGDEAEILRGGLYLSYGLHREAGEIFARLIDKGASPSVRDRAWYYLAKIRYQRGLLAEALDAIGRVQNALPAGLDEDRRLLQANLLMARGDYPGAAQVLQAMTAKGTGGMYARFNLGVALVKSGDVAGGTKWLDEVGRTVAVDEEMRSVRDKANVALGFAALQANQPQQATQYLERVRLNGMLANKALLGFGWANASLKQPKLALASWSELAGRDAADAAVLEAKLAVPYAYAELGAFGQSADEYNNAIAAFDGETASLDESVAAIRSGKLLDGLLASNPGQEMGWFWSIGTLPPLPHARHLAQILALHEFQEAFKNYRDLQFLAANLRQWEDKLGVFGDMLATRRQAYAERLPQVRANERGEAIDALEKRVGSLAAELDRAEQGADGAAFADAHERELAARLQRVRDALARAGDDPAYAAARERYRRVAGALAWQLSDEMVPRLADTKRALQSTGQGLVEAHRRDAALARAQVDEPAHFDAFAQRIADLQRRIHELMPRVAQLSREQQNVVQELAVAELEHEKERLALYTTQARFALAQTYDRANEAKDANHAAPAQ